MSLNDEPPVTPSNLCFRQYMFNCPVLRLFFLILSYLQTVTLILPVLPGRSDQRKLKLLKNKEKNRVDSHIPSHLVERPHIMPFYHFLKIKMNKQRISNHRHISNGPVVPDFTLSDIYVHFG